MGATPRSSAPSSFIRDLQIGKTKTKFKKDTRREATTRHTQIHTHAESGRQGARAGSCSEQGEKKNIHHSSETPERTRHAYLPCVGRHLRRTIFSGASLLCFALHHFRVCLCVAEEGDAGRGLARTSVRGFHSSLSTSYPTARPSRPTHPSRTRCQWRAGSHRLL